MFTKMNANKDNSPNIVSNQQNFSREILSQPFLPAIKDLMNIVKQIILVKKLVLICKIQAKYSAFIIALYIQEG